MKTETAMTALCHLAGGFVIPLAYGGVQFQLETVRGADGRAVAVTSVRSWLEDAPTPEKARSQAQACLQVTRAAARISHALKALPAAELAATVRGDSAARAVLDAIAGRDGQTQDRSAA